MDTIARAFLAVMAVSLVCGDASGQAIDPNHKFSWGENIGFMNWRDANGGLSGIEVSGTILKGYIWCENVGWVRIGDGSPASPGKYANAVVNGTLDWGVNIAFNGDLFGLAWGENIGWVNFDTRPTLTIHGKQARLDSLGLRFRGYAWAPNVGWINLDHSVHYVGISALAVHCAADFNADGVVNSDDFLAFLIAYFELAPEADIDQNGLLDSADFFAFLDGYFAGCP